MVSVDNVPVIRDRPSQTHSAAAGPGTSVEPKLTRNQIRGFWAAWGGWTLDGMDSFIYALVMTPALHELLPRSGLPDTVGEIGYYNGLLLALFLVGWGCSMGWGPIGDRFGRVRALILTIVCYSVFTFAGALATNVWQLAIFRLLAGVGVGGAWTLGGTFVAEEWPERRRAMGAGYMQTGFYVGTLLAALLNASIGARYGWRAMFALGGIPALLVFLIQYGVSEPRKWKPAKSRPMAMLFSHEYRRRTLLNSLFLFVSISGLWAGSVYVPSAVSFLSVRNGLNAQDATQMASWATVILSVATIFGCIALPPLTGRFGRRLTLAGYFALMFISISVAFGYAFYRTEHALGWFLVMLGALGFAGGNLTMYSIWLPEQYPSECRASAFGFATSVGRFAAAGITFLVGWGVSGMGTLGTPVALTSLAFVLGIFLLPWGLETKGQELPT
jgi:MFS family permease